jgi:hypothetical protein
MTKNSVSVIFVLTFCSFLCSASLINAESMGTVFTYQGRLLDNDTPANGIYEMEFKLYDSEADPNQINGTFSLRSVEVADGYFTVQLDFGSDAFNGDTRWLEIGIRPTGTADPFTTLDSRQEVTPSPYALYAETAGNAVGGIEGSGQADYIAKFTGTDTIANSTIYETSGNVGIGTIIPHTDLEILGTTGLRVTTGDHSNVFGEFKHAYSGGLIINANAGGGWADMSLQTDTVTRMFIESAGKVGIGTTSPQTKLHIEGGSDASLGGGGFLMIGSESTTNIVLDNNEIIARNNGNPAKLYLNRESENVVVNVLEITGGSDLAEPFEVAGAESIEPGMVVAIDTKNPGQLRIADKAYDRTVAGIVSGANGIKPGMTMSQKGTAAEGSFPVALTGRVYALADTSNGPIEPGDLLTTSQTPGHAMKVTDYSKAQGAILGKAMSSLDHGKGLVLVLVTLQ